MEEIIKFNAITLKAIGRDGEMYSLNDLWRMLGFSQKPRSKALELFAGHCKVLRIRV